MEPVRDRRAAFACDGKRGDMIKLLLKHGASTTQPDKHGVSPLKLAKTIGHYDVAQFFPGGRPKQS